MPARYSIFLVTLASAALLVGCSHSGGGDQSGSSGRASGVKLKDNLAPIHFVVTQGGAVTVRDATAGKSIARGTVAPSTEVSVDRVTGVRFGNKVIKQGPLPADHRYQILLGQSP